MGSCLVCGKQPKKEKYKFCSQSCAAHYKNTLRWQDPLQHELARERGKRLYKEGKITCLTDPRYRWRNAEAHTGEQNAMWAGDKAKYKTKHDWIRRHKPKPKNCEHCHRAKPLQLSSNTHKYMRDINEYEWLCKKCHSQKDMILFGWPKIAVKKHCLNCGNLIHSWRKFCSNKCSSTYRITHPETYLASYDKIRKPKGICHNCGSVSARPGRRFCSKKCWTEYQTGKPKNISVIKWEAKEQDIKLARWF